MISCDVNSGLIYCLVLSVYTLLCLKYPPYICLSCHFWTEIEIIFFSFLTEFYFRKNKYIQV